MDIGIDLTKALPLAGGAMATNYLHGASFTNIKFSNTLKARAAIRSRTANAPVLFLGDSNFAGYITGGGTERALASTPMQVAKKLQKLGINAGANSIHGAHNFYGGAQNMAMIATADSRISTVTGAAFPTFGVETIGGLAFAMNANTQGFTFTPQDEITHIEIGYAKNPAHGTFSYAVDGGAATNVNVNDGTTAIGKVTIGPLAKGSHSVRIAEVAGNVAVLWIYAYDASTQADGSTRREISIINGGIGGIQPSGLIAVTATFPYNRFLAQSNAANGINPCLTFLQGGVANAWQQNTPIATARADMDTLITQQLLTGDVILSIPIFDGSSVGSAPNQQAYVDMMYDLAATRGLGVYDPRPRLVSYAAANGAGLYSDATHKTVVGSDIDAGGYVEILNWLAR